MGSPRDEKVKLTKQGVRDLDHPLPRARPATTATATASAEETPLVAPTPPSTEHVAGAALEP